MQQTAAVVALPEELHPKPFVSHVFTGAAIPDVGVMDDRRFLYKSHPDAPPETPLKTHVENGCHCSGVVGFTLFQGFEVYSPLSALTRRFARDDEGLSHGKKRRVP